MPSPYQPNTPDQEVVELRIMDVSKGAGQALDAEGAGQITLKRWTSYSFSSDYLLPAAQFHFTISDGDLPPEERNALALGARVRLSINQIPLCDGHIDTVEISADRHGGVAWTVTGRERLGLAVDAIADPTQGFKVSMTLEHILIALYTPFGWIAPEHYSISNSASRAITQGLRGTPMSKGGKKHAPKPLKNFVEHQCKPHNHEGVHAFARRMTERHGLHIRQSEDGERLIVDTPDFAQEPSFEIHRSMDGTTNVLEGSVKRDFTNQAACIIADGYSNGGAEFGHGRIKAFSVNPYFGVDQFGWILNEVLEVLLKHPTAEQVVVVGSAYERRSTNVPARIVFIHDEESKKPAELRNFVRRQMSLLMRKSLTAHYTLEGHGQDVNGAFRPWMVDTVVSVVDEVAGISERMWVNDVKYTKSRGHGTTTTVSLLRLNSLQFGEQYEDVTTQTGKPKPKDFLSDDEFLRGLRLQRGLTGPLPPHQNGTLIRNTLLRHPGERVVDMGLVRNLLNPNLLPPPQLGPGEYRVIPDGPKPPPKLGPGAPLRTIILKK